MVIVGAVGCLALAWWQWTRFESASGSFQNLGYALQWPLFAGFVVYAYYKFVRYEEAPPSLEATAPSPRYPRAYCPKDPKPQHNPTIPRCASTTHTSPTSPRKTRNTDDMTEATSTPVETIRKALLGYRIMAWTTGIWLIALCYEIVCRTCFKVEDPPTGSASCTAGFTSCTSSSPPTSQ